MFFIPWAINVLRGKHTILKFFSESEDEGENGDQPMDAEENFESTD